MKGIDKVTTAIQLRDAGHFDQAAAIIRTLREGSTHPRDMAYLAVMEASCHREMGDFECAVALLSKARAVAQKDDSVSIGIEHEAARVERAQGRKAQALKRTTRVLERFRKLLATPQYSAVADQLAAEKAMLMAENGLHKEALPLLTDCHIVEPARSDVLYYLGDASFRTNRFEEAVRYLNEALQRSDLDDRLRPSAQYLLAYSYYSLGIYAQAINTLQKLETDGVGEIVSPRSVYEMLADCYHRLGMESESANYHDKASRLS